MKMLLILVYFFTLCIGNLTIIPKTVEVPEEQVPAEDEAPRINPALAQALREINDDPTLLEGTVRLPDKPLLSEERMKEIEEVMEWLYNQGPKDEIDAVKEILERLETTEGEEEELINDLELLRDFLHQVDNGVDFGKLNGFETMVRYSRHESEKVRVEAWWAIGVACSNNVGAIELALEHEIMTPLVNALSVEDKPSVLLKIIYALGSIMRQHRHAQQLFEDQQGHLFLKTLYWTSDVKLKRKIETLVVDVVTLNEWNSLFQTSSWCELFRDGIINKEADYTQVSNSLRFFANAVATCPKTRKFRRRLKILEKELQEDGPDPDVARWVEYILSNRKEKKASQKPLEALGYVKPKLEL